MRLPPKVKVTAHDIALVPMSHAMAVSLGEQGQFLSQERAIHYDESLSGPMLADVVLHEILHAIWWLTGLRDEDPEERVITSMATTLTQVLRDNETLSRALVTLVVS